MTSSKGELILAISSFPASQSRIYFGIDLSGNPIFKDSNNKDVYIIKKTISRTDKIERYESQAGIIKINGEGDNNKEYFINLGKSKTYIEIFDINDYNNDIIEKDYTKIINVNMKSFFGSFLHLYENNNNYYIISLVDEDNKFFISKLYFEYDSCENIKCTIIKNNTINGGNNRITSCYLNNNMIVCAFFSENSKYKIIILNTDFTILKEKELEITSQNSLSFHKLIYLKENIGLFSYYTGIENDFPSIQIIEAKLDGTNYLIKLIDNEIELNQFYFENSTMLTDFVKIKEDLVGLISAIKGKEILAIVLP